MSINYEDRPINEIRRSDRAITDDSWIRAFLHRADFGHLATVSDNQPFINSNIFAYDEVKHVIYLHTARKGRTQVNVAGGSRVCFAISEMGRLLPAKEALEFSVEYAGVMVFGTAVIVDDPVEAEHGLQLILDKYAPHLRPNRDYRPIIPEELKRTAVYRINIEQWSGKQKVAADDFPGAYLFAEVPK